MKDSYLKDKICPVCGYANQRCATQCHHCTTAFDSRTLWQKFIYKIRVFKRLNDLELQNKKLYAALAKVCKRLEKEKIFKS